MPRSLWTGSISFGLVNVPVKLTTAVRKKDVRFHQLHLKDGSRIVQKRFCAEENVEVAYEELAKGYEIAPGQHVMIDPEELEELDPVATHTIDIEDFVHLDQIDPLFYDSSYYLVPDERGAKPYRLLLEAMQEADKVGIARAVRGWLRSPAVMHELPKVSAPTLVIAGEEDETVKPHRSRSLSDSVHRGRFLLLPRCGHSSPVEAPEAVNEALLGLFEQARTREPAGQLGEN